MQIRHCWEGHRFTAHRAPEYLAHVAVSSVTVLIVLLTYDIWVWDVIATRRARMIQAFTSTDDDEIVELLDTLKHSSAGTGFMHESFNANNVSDYTRPWFAWANSVAAAILERCVNASNRLVYAALWRHDTASRRHQALAYLQR